MSKRKGINELSIMKKEMTKHLKKDMKDEMTRYKDDKDEIRRMVRGGTLITNYKGPGNTKRNVNYINDDNLITFEDIIDNVRSVYSPNYIYLQTQYKNGNLNPDENIAFDEATTYLKLKSPETKSQFLINYKQNQEESKKEYNERKKRQLEIQEERKQTEEKNKADAYDISTRDDFHNAVWIVKQSYATVDNWEKFENFVLIPEVRQSLKLTDNFERFLDHKKIKKDMGIITVGGIMDKQGLNKSMASFDFYQKGINGGKNLFIDTKFYNDINNGKYDKTCKYETFQNKGVLDLIKLYDKTYNDAKIPYNNLLSNYYTLSEDEQERFNKKYKKGFDHWFHNHSDKFNYFVPLTVAKIKGSSAGDTLVEWIGDKITVKTKYGKDLFKENDYADDIKFIISYNDGVYEVDIKKLPFFNKKTHELELGLDKYKKDYRLPPKYLKLIKKFI